MDYNLIENKIIAYFEGELSQEGRDELEKLVSESEELKTIFSEYTRIYEGFGEAKEAIPSQRLNRQFEDMLESKINVDKAIENKTKIIRLADNRKVLLYAASVLLIGAICFLWGTQNANQKNINGMNEQLLVMQKTMHNMLDDKSTSTRIQAVNMTDNMGVVGDDVVQVLINTMNNDQSPNVRLAAMESLSKFTNRKYVKDSLIAAMLTQEDPMIKIGIINILSDIKEENAIENLNILINTSETLELVKQEANKGKFKIEKI